MSGGGELFPFAPPLLINKGYGETTMDEHFVQGVVGGVLNRHKNRTLDKKKIAVLAVEIAAVLERATQYTDVKDCLLYTSPSPRDRTRSRMPSSA